MSESSNWDLLAKFIAGECSEQESKEVNEWIKSNPENKKLLNALKKGWDLPEKDLPQVDTEQMWINLTSKAGIASKGKKSFHINFSYLRAVAAVVLLALLPILYFSYDSLFNDNYIVHSVPFGANNQIVLEDGSKINLDAGSTLKYSNDYNKEIREVFIEGEGFFEVAHNPEKPFIVNFSMGQVKVLGTKFNVRNWPELQNTKVTVSEGMVSLSNENGNIILTKGFMGNIDIEGQITSEQNIDAEKSKSWMNKEFYFQNVKLNNILSQLERWYDVKFDLQNQSIGNEHLTVHIEPKPIGNILELISVITNLDYQINGNRIRLFTK